MSSGSGMSVRYCLSGTPCSWNNLAPESSQYISCDIYTGRIKPSVKRGDPYGEISRYLLKAAAAKSGRNPLDHLVSYSGSGSCVIIFTSVCNFRFNNITTFAKKLLTLPLCGDNISALKRQHRCEYGGKEKVAMKKSCFMMMAMMMRMCGMRTFSDAVFSDQSIITD